MQLSSLTLYAGTKWSWTENPENYPSPTYALKLYLKLKTNAAIEITSTPNGTGFLFDVNPPVTNLTAGNYSYQFQAFDNQGLMYFIEAGTKEILPNLAVATDSRTYWELIADEAKSAYQTLVKQVADSITLSDGKQITFANRKELLKIIHNAEIKAGLKPKRKITYTRFINP